MYTVQIKDDLKKDLDKLKKKDKSLHEEIGKKILKLAENPELGKPLMNVMAGLRRIHVGGSKVLIYEIKETEKKIYFISLDNHDKAYLKRPRTK